jgi:rieske iron-sulfur protein
MVKTPITGIPKRDSISRRRLLEGVVAGSIALHLGDVAAKSTDPRKLPAQPEDLLSYPSWGNEVRSVCVSDIVLDSPPVLAYPQDPVSGTVREKSRLNQILLLRFEEVELSDATKEFAVDGIVAYSGVCTHTGCSVTEWASAERNLLCPCHGSQFNPRERATIIGGPALRPLPILPLGLDGEKLKVAGAFSGRVGAKKK